LREKDMGSGELSLLSFFIKKESSPVSPEEI
jgi:hypothetical protein